MKRRLAFLLVLCTVFALVACSGQIDSPAGNASIPAGVPSEQTTEPTTEPTTAPPYAASWNKEFNELLNTIGTPETSDILLDIPVYSETKLLVESYGLENGHGEMFDPCIDASYWKSLGKRKAANYAEEIFHFFPTNAIRVRTDGSSYAVYDTDTAYRFYLFFDSYEPRTVGFPVLVKKGGVLLSHSDFKDVQVGDSIEKVEAIDSLTALYKRCLTSPKNHHGANVFVDPYASIHYLKDGILKIEYSFPETGEIIVSKIAFDNNFHIENAKGEMINHKIKDIDLPVA